MSEGLTPPAPHRVQRFNPLQANDYNYLAERLESIEVKLDYLIALGTPPTIIKTRNLPPDEVERTVTYLREQMERNPDKPLVVMGDVEIVRRWPPAPAPLVLENTDTDDTE